MASLKYVFACVPWPEMPENVQILTEFRCTSKKLKTYKSLIYSATNGQHDIVTTSFSSRLPVLQTEIMLKIVLDET